MPFARVHLLPSLVTPDELAGRTAVVIDVLRATTTIVQALASGAEGVVPCLEVDEARQRAAAAPDGSLTGGERGGVKIDGFELGNSPAEYTPEVVRGKTVFFTTTNGTRAMQRCRGAQRVLIGAFTNFSALCTALQDEPALDLVCAGTDGVITREDVLLAGAIVEDLLASRSGLPSRTSPAELNDQALIALDAWQAARADLRAGGSLAERLRGSRGGRNLIEIGQERDIDIAADIDRHTLVPELDLAAWRIGP